MHFRDFEFVTIYGGCEDRRDFVLVFGRRT